MYAVVRAGGKQYKVAKDDVIRVEKIAAAPGEAVSLGEVLLLRDGGEAQVGTPVVSGASVSATVVEQTRGDKIVVFKKKRRKNYRRRMGHRQHLTVLRIDEILAPGAKPSARKAEAKPAKAEPAAKAPARPAKKTKDSKESKARTATKAKTAKPAAGKKTTKKATGGAAKAAKGTAPTRGGAKKTGGATRARSSKTSKAKEKT